MVVHSPVQLLKDGVDGLEGACKSMHIESKADSAVCIDANFAMFTSMETLPTLATDPLSPFVCLSYLPGLNGYDLCPRNLIALCSRVSHDDHPWHAMRDASRAQAYC